MNSFLKKLGSILARVAEVALSVGPIIQPFMGSGKTSQATTTALNDLTSIGSVVLQIETALQGKPGADKLAAALPLVSNIVKTSELVVGKQVADEALFTKACQEFTQATVDLLNSIDHAEAKTA
jgi:hypothetical protein